MIFLSLIILFPVYFSLPPADIIKLSSIKSSIIQPSSFLPLLSPPPLPSSLHPPSTSSFLPSLSSSSSSLPSSLLPSSLDNPSSAYPSPSLSPSFPSSSSNSTSASSFSSSSSSQASSSSIPPHPSSSLLHSFSSLPLHSSTKDLLFPSISFVEDRKLNEKPIIGILSQPSSWVNIYDPEEFSYIANSYVQSIQGAGARVVPIKYDLPDDEIFKLMDQINGLLLPGGGTELTFEKDGKKEKIGNLTKFGSQAVKIIKYAEKLNQKTYFPVWGTCLGYEIMLLAGSDNNTILENYDSSNHTESLQFVRIFGKLPKIWKDYLQKKKVIYFNHNYGISEESFIRNKILNENYLILAKAADREGREFVSAIEGKKIPFYGVQFHPEKNAYEWKDHLKIDHSLTSIQIMRHFMDFFISECRKNFQFFSNKLEEKKHLIYNYYPVQMSNSFHTIYFFTKAFDRDLFRAVPIQTKMHFLKLNETENNFKN